MAKYTVEDSQTGKRVTFQWDAQEPPTDADMEQVFATARQQQPDKFQALAKTAAGIVEPGPQQVPGQSWLQKLGTATKETFLPSMDGLKRLFSPQVGQFGLSRLAQQAGEKVQGAVSSISPTAGAILPPLTPRSAAEQMGGEALVPVAGAAVGAIAKPLGNVAAKSGQLLSGKRISDYTRLAKDPAAILPEVLGGSKSIGKAGEQLGEAMSGAGLRKPLQPFAEYPQVVKDAYEKAVTNWKNIIRENQPNLANDAFEKALENPKAIKEAVRTLEPKEAFNAYRSIQKILKTSVEGKDKELFRSQVLFKNALQEHLGELSGAYKTASKEFARAALGKSFLDIFPTTKYGVPSIGRMGFASLLALPKYAALPLTSPLVHGVVTAGVGALSKIPGKANAERLGFQALLAKYRSNQNAKK